MDSSLSLSSVNSALPVVNNQTIVIIGIVLLLLLVLLYFNLYVNNISYTGNSLDWKATLKKLFRIPEISTELSIGTSPNNIKSETKINVTPYKPEKRRPLNPSIFGETPYVGGTQTFDKKSKCNRGGQADIKFSNKKEVFNIDNNDFTYDEAHLMCKSLGSKLASYSNVLNAHKKGANWCNYGWSANGLALYPTQKKFWNKLQEKGGKHKTKCGKPGVNGGFFPDKSLKFGVNCYGYKPLPDESKIVYTENNCDISKELMDKYRNKFKNGDIEVRPFNKIRWSTHSDKHSKYIITPKGEEDIIMEKELGKVIKH